MSPEMFNLENSVALGRTKCPFFQSGNVGTAGFDLSQVNNKVSSLI